MDKTKNFNDTSWTSSEAGVTDTLTKDNSRRSTWTSVERI